MTERQVLKDLNLIRSIVQLYCLSDVKRLGFKKMWGKDGCFRVKDISFYVQSNRELSAGVLTKSVAFGIILGPPKTTL